MKQRVGKIQRKTSETSVTVELDLDGTGQRNINSGIPFLDHMLELLAKHSLIDLRVEAKGDLKVDYHHTVEDVGLCLGAALNKALGGRTGITRYGSAIVPMDEALSQVVIDLGGRPFLVYDVSCRRRKIHDFSLLLISELFRALSIEGRMNIHVSQIYGIDPHHAYESIFKALARALRVAVAMDPREKDVPSSKGII